MSGRAQVAAIFGIIVVVGLGVFFAVYSANEPEYVAPAYVAPAPTASPVSKATADYVPWFKTFRMVGDPIDPVWNHVNEQMRLILKGKIKGIDGIKGAGVDSMPGHAVLNLQKITASPAIEAECGFTYTYLAKALVEGKAPFKSASTAFEGVATTHTQALQIIVKANSGIDSVSGLKGKKLSTGYQPQPDESLTQAVISAYGISVNVENNFFDLGLQKLTGGEVDAISYFVPIGSDEVAKLFKANNLKVLRIDGKILATLESQGITNVVIPAGTYKGVTENVRTVGSNSIWVCSSELSPDAVKDIAGFLVGNISHFAKERPELASLSGSTAWMDMGIPMHYGAELYYMEDCKREDGTQCMTFLPPPNDVPWFKTFRMVGDPLDPVWNHVNEQMRLILKGKIKGIEGVKGAGVDSMPGHAILNIQKITASPAIEAECGFTYTYLAKAAMNGSSPFKEKSTAFEGVAKTHTQALQIIVKSDSGIDSVSDLDGKKLSTGYQPQPDESLTQSVLKKYGISANVENNFFDLGLVKLSEGEVDAISYFVPIGSDEVAKLFKANKLKVLSVDRDVPGISSVVIPSGTYKGVKSDVSTIGSNSIWVCSSELSTEAVKDITGFLVGNIDHFAMERPELTSMTASTASEDIGIPMHPGAEAYYKS